MKKEIYKTIISIAENIARIKKGALIVIVSPEKMKDLYSPLYPQGIRLDLKDRGADKVIEKLATLDGAVLISPQGEMYAYGVRVRKSKAIQGFGTRHAAAKGITEYTNSTALLVSEESNLIRIFRKGKIILEMDAKEKPKNLNNKILSFLSEGDTALLAAAGASAAMAGPSILLGPIMAPIIIVGGSVYFAMKAAAKFMKDHSK